MDSDKVVGGAFVLIGVILLIILLWPLIKVLAAVLFVAAILGSKFMQRAVSEPVDPYRGWDD